jgi:hypothetical protein
MTMIRRYDGVTMIAFHLSEFGERLYNLVFQTEFLSVSFMWDGSDELLICQQQKKAFRS